MMKDIEFILPDKSLSIAFLVIAVIFFVFLYLRLPKRKLLFSILRLLVFLLIIFLFSQPEYNVREELAGRKITAVLLDNSQSMGLNDPGSRWQEVKRFFSRQPFQKLGKKYDIKYFTFSDKFSTWTEGFIKSDPERFIPQPIGKTTNLSQALREIKKIDNLAGIFLVSDGQNNQGDNPLMDAENLGLPVYTLGVGNPRPKDLAIEEIKHGDFAFKNTPVSIEVEISGYGFEGKDIPVSLIEKDTVNQIIRSENARIDNQGKARVKITFTPSGIGEKIYLVSVPTYKEEISLTNNAREFLLNTVREKIRLLYLCGQINYEYAFIRKVIKNDPTIELVSFVILRNPENIAFVPDDQLSLIPFPAHEIFIKELYNYDLIIIENFTYHRFGILSQYLDNLYRFVNDNGGGLVMIGGENAFGRGGYKGTSLENLFPVEIYHPHTEKIMPGLFRMQVENYQHPITNLGNNPNETMRIWQRMPELDGYNQLGKAKAGATVLGFHPQDKAPILAVWDKGKGRVVIVTSNTTWRWPLGLNKEGESEEIYNRFWQNIIRWSIRAEEMKPIKIILEKKKYFENEKIPVEIRIYDKNYQLLKKTKVKFYLSDRQNKTTYLSDKLQNLPEGGYWAELNIAEPGDYTLSLEAWDKDIYLGEEKIHLQVTSAGEKDRFMLNQALLSGIARISGGEYLPLAQFDPENIEFPGIDKLTGIKRKISLWNQPYFYFLICLFLVIEWYLRRRTGLL